jgi:hypothetical protein
MFSTLWQAIIDALQTMFGWIVDLIVAVFQFIGYPIRSLLEFGLGSFGNAWGYDFEFFYPYVSAVDTFVPLEFCYYAITGYLSTVVACWVIRGIIAVSTVGQG